MRRNPLLFATNFHKPFTAINVGSAGLHGPEGSVLLPLLKYLEQTKYGAHHTVSAIGIFATLLWDKHDSREKLWATGTLE